MKSSSTNGLNNNRKRKNPGIIERFFLKKDALTGISNGNAFGFQARRLILKNAPDSYTVGFFNLKNFKHINRMMTSEIGDAVIISYSHILNSFVQKNELCARLGGDNFIVLIKDERVDEFIEFVSEVDVPVNVEEELLHFKVGARIGLYSLKTGDTISEVMNNSSIALIYAKEQNKNDVIWYDNNIAEYLYKENEVAYNFKDALRNREFEIYYQPKVNIETNKLAGCEALVRWKKGDRFIQPVDFVPALEKNGLISKLDFYVLDQVCRDIRKWQDSGINSVVVSTNFSRINLNAADFVRRLLDVVDSHKIDKKMLQIELTESTNNNDYESFISFLEVMAKAGISTAIDDFGVGYSSLELIKNPNVNVIKLDKRFVDNIEINGGMNDHSLLLKNIINICHDMKKQIVCEGVGKKGQIDLLKDMNCKIIQGYYFDKPLSRGEFEERLVNPTY